MPYAPTVTLVPAGYPVPRTELLFATVHPSAATATVYRNAGGRTFRVRSGIQAAAAGGFGLIDNEVPFTETFTYNAEMFDASGLSLGFTDSSEPASLGAVGTVIHNPVDATRAATVTILDGTAGRLVRPFRGEFVHALGRSTPTWVGNGRSGLTGLGVLVMTTGAQTDALRAIFGEYDDIQMPVIVFRSSVNIGVPGTLFLGVPEPEYSFLVNDEEQAALWTLTGDETSPPAESIGFAPLSYGDLESFFELYSEMETAKGTYLGLETYYALTEADPTTAPSNVIVTYAGISSSEGVGSPNIGGPVVLEGEAIPSLESVGSPSVIVAGEGAYPGPTLYPSSTLYPGG